MADPLPFKPQAFTIQYSGRARELFCDVGVAEYDPANTPGRLLRKAKAIWDTGATGSVVTAGLARELKLVPIGRGIVQGATGSAEVNVYMIDVALPNHVGVVGVRVTESPELAGGCQVLIGMDIISMGDFAVTNRGGRTKFSFQLPSTRDTDFVAETNRENAADAKKALNRQARREYEKNLRKDRSGRKRRRR